MKQQSADHYLRFYPLHHFIFYPVMMLLAIACFREAYTSGNILPWALGGCGFLSLVWVSYMLRQHYALLLQDRVIRLEMRYRYFSLTGKRLEALEPGLTDAQLFALRFAGDEELEGLVEKAVKENHPAGKIRRSVKKWKADIHRV